MRVLIVDDEPAARQLLSKAIAEFPQLELVGESGDGRSAIRMIPVLKPDIVFLDIEMPEVGGFEVAKATQDQYFQLVFITAYEQYALDAFDTRAIAYLLKPARPALIRQCIDKILRQEQQLLERKQQLLPRITLSENDTIRVISPEHICFIEGIGRYRRIHLTQSGALIHQSGTLLSEVTLNDFERKLPTSVFIRLHRTYIVNIQTVSYLFSRLRRSFVKLNEYQEPIPVARSQMAKVKQLLSSMTS